MPTGLNMLNNNASQNSIMNGNLEQEKMKTKETDFL